jgi:hypothetical protein
MKDKYICFDEHKFLLSMANIVKNNGGIILEKTPFLDYERKGKNLIINKKFETQLLVDCTGIHSPIIQKHALIKLPLYINCYSYIAEFDKVKNEVYYRFYKRDNDDEKEYLIFSLTKVAPKKALLLFCTYTDDKVDPKKYKTDFNKALKKYNIPQHKILEWKIGSYPSGLLKSTALDNIFLFGDAGFYSPSFNGMGFNEILRQYHRVAKHLNECIKNNKYSKKFLMMPQNIAIDINNLIFRFLALINNDISVEMMNKMFDFGKNLTAKDVKAVMRNDVTDREAIKLLKKIVTKIGAGELIKCLSKEHLINIVKTMIELEIDIFSEEFHNLMDKKHKIKIKDMYYN